MPNHQPKVALRQDIAQEDRLHLAREFALPRGKHDPTQPSHAFPPKVSGAWVALLLLKACSSLHQYSAYVSRDKGAKRLHKPALHQ